MKIISGYRDYYDWVAHAHGGGDPLVTYERDFVTKPEIAKETWFSQGRDPESVRQRTRQSVIDVPVTESVFVNQRSHNTALEDFDFTLISVAGRAYFFQRRHRWSESAGPWTLMDRPYKKEPKIEGAPAPRFWSLWHSETDPPVVNSGELSSQLVKLHIKHGAPVLQMYRMARSDSYLRIDPVPPVLADFGLPSVLPAEQAYQEIAQMMGQILHARAEIPEIQTSEQKIESHGFDKRKSFRHRK